MMLQLMTICHSAKLPMHFQKQISALLIFQHIGVLQQLHLIRWRFSDVVYGTYGSLSLH